VTPDPEVEARALTIEENVASFLPARVRVVEWAP